MKTSLFLDMSKSTLSVSTINVISEIIVTMVYSICKYAQITPVDFLHAWIKYTHTHTHTHTFILHLFSITPTV